MDKRRSNYYLRRIYKLLSNGEYPIIFAKMKTCLGQTDHTHIWLDPSKDLLPTFIHEAIHVLYPKWKHRRVYRTEKGICNNLTSRQFANLFHRLEEAIKNQVPDHTIPAPPFE